MTTIRFGDTRYGPSAPDTSQFGKYDAFTSTGTPTSSTENEIVSLPISMSLTSTSGSALRGSSGTWSMGPDSPSWSRAYFTMWRSSVGTGSASTRSQSSGPLAARGTSRAFESRNQAEAVGSQPSWLWSMPSTTTGWLVRLETGSASATS